MEGFVQGLHKMNFPFVILNDFQMAGFTALIVDYWHVLHSISA
jgi:hypothetical protein